MGNSAPKHFALIEQKYGAPAIDYIARKHFERTAFAQTRDETQRILDHAELQEREDLEWIDQERRLLDQAMDEAKNTAENKQAGLIHENETKHKQSVSEFSGYNDEVKRLHELERHVKKQYRVESDKVRSRVEYEIKKTVSHSTLKELP